MTDKTYLKCLARERDRERKHRATAKAVTGANALHYDAAHVQGEGETMDFGFDVSDNGEGGRGSIRCSRRIDLRTCERLHA